MVLIALHIPPLTGLIEVAVVSMVRYISHMWLLSLMNLQVEALVPVVSPWDLAWSLDP